MKLLSVNTFALTVVTAIATPRFNLLAREDPSYAPVTFVDAPNGNITCGDVVYTEQDIYHVVAWGTLLQDADQTRGNASFPHPFTHGEVFGLPDKCGEVGDPNLQEYPVEQGWMYNGTALNDTENFDRVVYLHTKGETDSLYNHPQATFCGVVTKTWAPGKGLVLCTWEGCCDP
ncbi:hypothetical protein KC343_g7378 [Hortaea werneckii]|nr:hypothetical protein KC338_g8718 [Hortaea werneckii]KAI6874464.1 hypothetical protein KC323_g709 [Hortaea werneckii]KAI7235972.1 hypothetical protein KC352_g15017 [Hortaea werneckii]KAI7348870.1 hypothetical protein KC320_g6397 [Hortaea werneckii]KAI7563156.1 hypothetical protein KC317_g7922 [Hortaea werneckii]